MTDTNTTPETQVTPEAVSNKPIGMPTDDEMFTAFWKWLLDGTPDTGKKYIKMFEPFLEKAKPHIKSVVTLEEKGLSFNISEEIGNKLLKNFVDSQGLLLRLPLRTTLALFGADSFTSFIADTKKGNNNPEKTIGWFTRIISIFFQTLGENYAIIETSETIKEKMEKVFA